MPVFSPFLQRVQLGATVALIYEFQVHEEHWLLKINEKMQNKDAHAESNY